METDNSPSDWAPNEPAPATHGRSQRRVGCIFAIIALLGMALCVLTSWQLWQGPVRNLRPFRPQPTHIALVVDGKPQLVTFPELSQHAHQYQDKRIRVTGFYLPLTTPDCAQHNGPVFQWAIISQGLQLNAIGFERPLALVSTGSTLTVEGVWRLYQGPTGCGKSSERSNVWYLHVEQIVQPNPLTASTRDPEAYLLSGVSTPIFPTVGPTNTPRPGATNTPTLTATPQLTETATAVGSQTPTGPLPTLSATARTSTATVAATATSSMGLTPTTTRSSTGTPAASATPATTVTAIITNTPPPGGYPGPGNTPIPPIVPTLTPGY